MSEEALSTRRCSVCVSLPSSPWESNLNCNLLDSKKQFIQTSLVFEIQSSISTLEIASEDWNNIYCRNQNHEEPLIKLSQILLFRYLYNFLRWSICDLFRYESESLWRCADESRNYSKIFVFLSFNRRLRIQMIIFH